jgi:D-inositol-3-phosphate glycosyltransferase
MIKRLAIITVHASPLALLGTGKAGGMNSYLRALSAEFGKRGMAVDIFTRRISTDEPEIDCSIGENVRVIRVNAGPLGELSPEAIYPHLSQFTAGVIAFTTRQALAYELIYTHYWLSGWVGDKLSEVWGTPFVHMYHTLGHMKNRITDQKYPILPDVRIRTETDITRQAHRLIAATPAEQAQLLWLYRADRRKISIASPGVDLNNFHPIDEAEAKAFTGVPADKKLLLFVGRPEPLKGVDSILDALALIRQQDTELFQQLLFGIIGGNPDDPADAEVQRLRRRVADLQLEASVIFMGPQNQKRLPYYYASAIALIMPSDYESFGMVALEAMATGTPVIASEVGGLQYLVKDGLTGYLTPVRNPAALAENITDLLQNPAKHHEMRIAAATWAHQYAWDFIADQLITIFNEVLAQPYTNRRKN